MQTIELPIRGMTCASCVATIERELGGVPGVQRASVNLAAAQATITYDPAIAQVNQLIQAIEDAGYQVKAAREPGGNVEMANQPSTTHTLKQIFKMGACCAGPIIGLALLAPLAGALGIGVSSILSGLLVLACPLGMLLMMYLAMRGQKARMQGQRQATEEMLPKATPTGTAGTMAEGDGQLAGRKGLPILEEGQASPVSARAARKRQGSRLPG